MGQRPALAHLAALDVARTLCILPVLAGHITLARFCHGDPQLIAHDQGIASWMSFAKNGAYGVSMFFVLSGFLITRSIVNDHLAVNQFSIKQFYVRRAARILPLLFLVVALGFCLSSWGFVSSRAFVFLFQLPAHPGVFFTSISTFWFNLYRVWNIGPDVGLGLQWNILWSLSVEEQFYLAYPLLLKAAGSTTRVCWFLLGFVIAGPLFRYHAFLAAPHDYFSSLQNSLCAFDQIAIGCLLFFCWRSTKEALSGDTGHSSFFVLTGLLIMIWIYVRTNVLISGIDRIYGPSLFCLGIFLFLIGLLSIPGADGGWAKIVGLPGRLSFGMYLLHPIVLLLSWTFIGAGNPWLMFAIFFALTASLSYSSFRWFEQPMNRLIRRLNNPESITS